PPYGELRYAETYRETGGLDIRSRYNPDAFENRGRVRSQTRGTSSTTRPAYIDLAPKRWQTAEARPTSSARPQTARPTLTMGTPSNNAIAASSLENTATTTTTDSATPPSRGRLIQLSVPP